MPADLRLRQDKMEYPIIYFFCFCFGLSFQEIILLVGVQAYLEFFCFAKINTPEVVNCR